MNPDWLNDPEAFFPDYEENKALLRQLAEERRAQEQVAIALITLLLELGIAKLEAVMAERGENFEQENYNIVDDCPMDGDAESALASAGFGTDEDYGGFTHDWEE